MKTTDLLARYQVASPCRARWEDMEGDERARFCGQCRKHVYNLSAMTAEAADRLVREKEGKLCGRFFVRPDGTMLHAEDCPVGFAARQWRRARHFAGAAASLVLLLLGIQRTEAGTVPEDPKKPAAKPTPAEPAVFGEMCPITPTPTPAPTPKK